MRNVIGPFRNNVLCKFDLKGSSVDRRTHFQLEVVHKIVMKDINFEEIEKYLVLDNIDIERLRSGASADAYFLTDMEIMDYSLFVVKLSMSVKDVRLYLN